jgi:chromosome segregation ATPase
MKNWNEKEISNFLVKQQENPQVVQHFVATLRQRFINNQDTKVAQTRIKFLEEQVKTLRLANEFSDLQSDLSVKRQEYDNRLLVLKSENQKIRLSMKDEETEKQIHELETQRRMAEKERDIVALQNEIDELKRQPPSQLTPQEIKAKKKADVERKIKKVSDQIKEINENSSLDEHSKQTRINQLENKKYEFYEELDELL